MKADHKKILNRLNRIKGQISGVIKMVEEDKYCLEISNQLMAISSAINATNREVLSAHLQSCAKDALLSQDKDDIDKKIEEIEAVIKRLSK